jgi:uncharacterized protein (DUF427 family)
MTQAHQITITPAQARVEVSLNGQQLASSDQAVVLDETGLRPRYYFPREDVRMDLLKPTSTQTTCPFKGEASYWSVVTGGEVHEDLVWGYETPIPPARRGAPRLAHTPRPLCGIARLTAAWTRTS